MSAAPGHRRRRIVVVNANASAGATATIRDHLAPRADPGTALRVLGAEAGPRGIDGPLDGAIAAVETAAAIARLREDADAFVLACGNDPGLDACRQATTRPVVGLLEAGIHVASLLGATFSVAVLAPEKVNQMRALVRGYGLADRLASVIAMETSATELFAEPEAGYAALRDRCARARDEDAAETIVLPGAAMAPVAERLAADLGMPVVDGLSAALRLAEALADLGLQTSQTHTYRRPAKTDPLVGHPTFADVYETPEPHKRSESQ
jgi:allantoin racemase